MKVLTYTDDTEKEVLKAQEIGKGLVLSAEYIHEDGKHLVFIEPELALSVEARVTALEVRVAAVEKKP